MSLLSHEDAEKLLSYSLSLQKQPSADCERLGTWHERLDWRTDHSHTFTWGLGWVLVIIDKTVGQIKHRHSPVDGCVFLI